MVDGLTAIERRIANLVARGLRNDEAAVDLGVSPKTIEWHLTKTYRKLGVRSRTELAALVATQPAERDERRGPE